MPPQPNAITATTLRALAGSGHGLGRRCALVALLGGATGLVACSEMWGIDELSYQGAGPAPSSVGGQGVGGQGVGGQGGGPSGGFGGVAGHGATGGGGAAVSLGEHAWSRAFGDGDEQTAVDVAVDTSGSVYLFGEFRGAVDFAGSGEPPLVSAGGVDVALVKLDANGEHLWGQRFGNSAHQSAGGVAVTPSGAVVVGHFEGSVDFGAGSHSAQNDRDLYVAKFDAAGQCSWSVRCSGWGSQFAYDVACDGAGNILLAGTFESDIDCGQHTQQSAGDNDIVVAKISASGGDLWVKAFGDEGEQKAYGVAVDDSGNVAATGYIHGGADFGGGVLQSAGGFDVFVVKLDVAGEHLWSQRFGDSADEIGRAVAMDGAGNVWLVGDFADTLSLGGAMLKSAGGRDVFVAAFDPNGQHLFSARYGDTQDQFAADTVLDTAGQLWLTGSFRGTLEFGEAPLVSAGDHDVFLARLTASGQPHGSRAFGGLDDQVARGLAVDEAGSVVMAGSLAGSMDWGGGPLVSAGGSDMFVAKLSP